MDDQREFIARVEAADADELARLLRHPSAAEAAALRMHFGEEPYERLRLLAMTTSARAAAAPPKGNVVVIPGLMGSELTAYSPGGAQEPIWLSVPRIVAGRLGRLRLGDDGLRGGDRGADVRPSGVLKRAYGELLLTPAARWNVRAFRYDWRKDLDLAADELHAAIDDWFGPGAPVHLIAHSSGGLVARAFIEKHPERWEAMWDRLSSTPGRTGGRLVLIGTPNHGSFQTVQILTGLAPAIRQLALLDATRDLRDLLKIVHSFVGLYPLLPSPLHVVAAEVLYEARAYGDLEVPQRHLDAAWAFHERLHGPIAAERLVCVAGTGQATYGDIRDYTRLRCLDAYTVTTRGDGTVTHDLVELSGVRTYYVKEGHAGLASNAQVLAALDDLLQAGQTERLGDRPPATPRGAEGATEEGRAREQLRLLQEQGEHRLRTLAGHLRAAAPAGAAPAAEVSQAEEILTRHLLSPRPAAARRPPPLAISMKHPRVELGLVFGPIEALDYDAILSDRGHFPIDAIAVGHYLGVKPGGSERALDRAISARLGPRPKGHKPLVEGDLLLTQYTERGILKGELGQPFFLPDPRDASARRLLVIMGMGVPGRFGTPELTVLARELCWAVGRLGKRHLAVASIGTRYKNLPLAAAVSGWVRGLKNAVTGAIEDEARHIQRLTFVLHDPRQIPPAQAAILAEINRLRGRLDIAFTALGPAQLAALAAQANRWDSREVKQELHRRRNGARPEADAEPAPTRVTLTMDGQSYHFGAITDSASVPERAVSLDPALVHEVNAKLAAEADPDRQLDRGRFLERLLVPNELREVMATRAPLVMMLDATTARIHWEMVAQSDHVAPEDRTAEAGAAPEFDRQFEYADYFLGTCRGLTRQLRLTFAPPPEAPPPPRRVLRVLVVADPAADAPLPGAEREGHAVADAFESFNAVYEDRCENRVEVVRLIGPREASRTEVLEHLMLRAYDVLHFAGHCLYDERNPSLSGWIFSGGRRLSVSELNRIDRVPKFVFSNACESGITPERSGAHAAGMAPSFAEAFFGRGVGNFVCTAWPVDDAAAQEFALRLYHGLLGLRPRLGAGPKYEPVPPEPIVEAMMQARREVAAQPSGARTWGAYQHYGNPYFRLFDPTTMVRPPASAAAPPETVPPPPAQDNGRAPGAIRSAARPRRKGTPR